MPKTSRALESSTGPLNYSIAITQVSPAQLPSACRDLSKAFRLDEPTARSILEHVPILFLSNLSKKEVRSIKAVLLALSRSGLEFTITHQPFQGFYAVDWTAPPTLGPKGISGGKPQKVTPLRWRNVAVACPHCGIPFLLQPAASGPSNGSTLQQTAPLTQDPPPPSDRQQSLVTFEEGTSVQGEISSEPSGVQESLLEESPPAVPLAEDVSALAGSGESLGTVEESLPSTKVSLPIEESPPLDRALKGDAGESGPLEEEVSLEAVPELAPPSPTPPAQEEFSDVIQVDETLELPEEISLEEPSPENTALVPPPDKRQPSSGPSEETASESSEGGLSLDLGVDLSETIPHEDTTLLDQLQEATEIPTELSLKEDKEEEREEKPDAMKEISLEEAPGGAGGERYKVFLSHVTGAEKQEQAAHLIAELAPCSFEDAQEKVKRVIVPVLNDASKEEAEAAVARFKELKIKATMTKKKG